MTLYLATYLGRGRWYDGAIRRFTGYDASHVELAWQDGLGWLGFSASPRDGGVRIKGIDFGSGNWRMTALDRPDAARVIARCQQLVDEGAGYDWVGLALSMGFAAGRHHARAWFCSEVVGHALGLPSPHRLSPGHLEEIVIWSQRGRA